MEGVGAPPSQRLGRLCGHGLFCWPRGFAILGILSGLLLAGQLPAAHTQITKKDRWGQPGKRVSLPPGQWVQTAADIDLRGNRLCAKMRRPDGQWAARDCVNVQYGQEFANNAGRFQLVMDEEIPGGTWTETARNIRREGDLLFADIRREDLSYVTVSTVVVSSTYFTNKDGVLFRQRAECLGMGSCLLSFFMKRDAKFLFCADIVCDPYLDLSTCCDVAMPCENLTTCEYPLVSDPDAYCDGPTCVPERDEDLCCVGRARCDSLGSCIYGYSLRKNAAEIECASKRCHPEDEADLCCDFSARCYTFSDDSCPPGYYFNGLDYCLGTSCWEWRDRRICCQPAQKCDGFHCPLGMTALYNFTDIWCEGPVCTTERDAEICCDPAESCLSEVINCPYGRIALNNTYCLGTSCFPERDLGHCCPTAERCNGLEHYECSLGYFFNSSDYCKGVWCDEDRDRQFCCQKAERCTVLECPSGYIAKPLEYVWAPGVPYDPDAVEPTEAPERPGPPPGGFGGGGAEVVTETTTTAPAGPGGYVENHYCNGLHCVMWRDMDLCCDLQAPCTDLNCPLGYVSAWDVQNRLCLGPDCLVDRDRDVCCEVAANCTAEYECPHGYVGKPMAFCDGTECDVTRDLEHCCFNAMPCTQNLTCLTNFVYKPDQYCSKAIHKPMPCTVEVDHDTCCTRGMVLVYFRFVPLTVRGDRNYMIQFAEFRLYFFGAIVEGSTLEQGAIAYSVGGNSPDKEGPEEAIDENLATKFLEEDPIPDPPLNLQPVTFKLAKAMPVNGYSFITANDIEGRDPASWRLEGSPDGDRWVVLAVEDDAASMIPEERLTESAEFPIAVPCFAPKPYDIDNCRTPFPCLEGDIMSSGSYCTAVCNPGYEPSIPALLCNNGQFEPWIYTCEPIL